MRALVVTKVLPLPANSGGRQRTLAVVRLLAQRCDVVLCAFAAPESDIAGLEAMGVEVRAVPRPHGVIPAVRGLVRTGSGSSGRFWDPALARAVGDVASAPFDLLLLEYVQTLAYTRGVHARLKVLGMHNVESSLVTSYAELAGGWRSIPLRLEAAALRRLERSCITAFDAVTVISRTDRDRLPATAEKVLVCPNGCDLAPLLPPAGSPVAAFVASLGWRPNGDAAEWLSTHIWPLVRRRIPDARLLLVGRDPSPAVRALARPDVEVSGTVADVRPYLARSRLALAPLRVGGGSRLKVLEALAGGRPVVATPKGIEGLEDLVGNGAVVAETEAAMADAIVRLLGDPVAAEELGRRGRQAVRARYSWQTTLGPLLDLVDGQDRP